MKSWVDGQVVIITGGAAGLGRALVESFVTGGARVVVFDSAAEKMESLTRDFGDDAVATLVGDVSRLADNHRAVELALARFGRVDTFIANAGIFDHSVALDDIADDRLEAAFDEIFAVNVKGPLFGAKASLPALVRSKGSLILTLSVAAKHAGCGGPIYTASKHAGAGLVHQLAHEFAPGVRVNGVAPGAIRTDLRGPRALDLQGVAIADVLPPPEVAVLSEPLGRFASAADHTGPYMLLASRELGCTLTGVVLHADSGAGIRGVRQPAGGRGLRERYPDEGSPVGDGDSA